MTVALDYDNYLAHYGVKGMKWGVRKDRDLPSSRVTYRDRKYHEYKSKGLSNKKASEKADRADKARKTALVVGGTTVAAATAYVAGNYYVKNYVGVNLKEGAMLQNVNRVGGSKPQKEGMLYVSFKERDNQFYTRFYGRMLLMDSSHKGKDVFKTKLTAIEPIKAPSNVKAKKLYEEYKRTMKNRDGASFLPDSYRDFNILFNYHGSEKDKKSFSDFMRQKGYNALVDINDQRAMNGRKKPTILLDSTKTATTVGHEVVTNIATIEELSNYRNRRTSTRSNAIGAGASLAGAVAVVGAKNKHKHSKVSKQVDQYFEEHPNTTKSPSEVYNMLSKKKKGGVK